MDQKNGFERLLLERRIAATKAEIDAREAQMHHVLVDVGKVQSAAVRQITDRPNPLQAKREKVAALGAHFETLDEVTATAARLQPRTCMKLLCRVVGLCSAPCPRISFLLRAFTHLSPPRVSLLLCLQSKTYVAMVAAAHAKLAEYGIAPNEMGFEVRGTLKDLAV